MPAIHHNDRCAEVASRAKRITRALQGFYPSVDTSKIELAAMLRKIRFDPELEKKNQLSPEEYQSALQCFRMSGEYAASLLVESLGKEGALKVKRIIDEHLEHFDGSGPLGKRGGEVIPEAYILNISIVIQNILEGMPNRNATGRSESLAESIVGLAGSQYPPRLVVACVRALDKAEEGETEMDNLMRMAEFGRISAAVFHDMAQYLTAIYGNFSLISGHVPKDSPAAEYCREGLAHVEKLVSSRKEILDFAKGRAQMKEGDINETIESAISLASSRLRHVRVERDFQDIPRTIYLECGIRHVFLNLLTNAADAIRSGGGIIRISTSVEEGLIKAVVSDNGIGMGPEQLDGIFSGETTKECGHGIGVRFCRYMAERHGGTLAFESNAGAGTIATLLLPLQ